MAAESNEAALRSQKANLLSEIGLEFAQVDSDRATEVLDQAQVAIAAMSDRCYQANSIARVAGGYLLLGETDKGEMLLTEAIETAKAQDATRCFSSATPPTSSLLNRAIEFAQAGQVDLAMQISSRLHSSPVSPETVKQLRAAGQSDEAIAQFLNASIEQARSLDSEIQRTYALLNIATEFRELGQTDQARNVLEQSLESAQSMTINRPGDATNQTSVILSTAREFAAIDENQRAIEILAQVLPKIRQTTNEEMPETKPTLLADAAMQYAKLGQRDQAIAILNEARTAAEAIAPNKAEHRQSALARLAEGYAKLGDFEQALQIARSFQSPQELWGRQVAFTEIAIAYVESGNLDAAVNLVRSLESPPAVDRPTGILESIVSHYLEQKQPEQALNLAQTWQIKTMNSAIATGFLEAKQPDRALQIVQANRIEGFMPDIARSYAELGQPDRALQLVKEQNLDETSLPAIARAFAIQGELDQALQIADSMTDKVTKTDALLAIAQVYTANQDAFESLFSRLIDRMRSLFGDSDREKAAEVLKQALQVAQSIDTSPTQ